MYISVNSDGVEVLESADYRRFHVAAGPALSLADIGDQLRHTRLGDISGEHAQIDISTLTDRLTDIGSYDAGQFSAMLTYADQNGWVTNDGRSLQAHIVRGDR